MGLKKLSILHIADLHCGYVGTRKESPVSSSLTRELDTHPQTLFLQRMNSLLRSLKVDIIAFTGDLRWGKTPSHLSQGVEYLKILKNRLEVEPDNVLVAPGNHDLNRSASSDREFDEFIDACQREGFTCSKRNAPAFKEINGIPVITLNTCLGGTEKAFYGLPEEFWGEICKSVEGISSLGPKFESTLPLAIKDQLIELDIPAVGNSQLEILDKYLSTKKGNCVIILGHHNLLPTHQLVVRPYPDILDSGKLIHNLLGARRHDAIGMFF